jgi:hypothetical protein
MGLMNQQRNPNLSTEVHAATLGSSSACTMTVA